MDALFGSAAAMRRLQARSAMLERENAALTAQRTALAAQSRRVRAEYRRVQARLQEQQAFRTELAALLPSVEGEENRALLRMRYLEGLSVPQMERALADAGSYYTQRHVERLLHRAERAARARWKEDGKKEEEDAG